MTILLRKLPVLALSLAGLCMTACPGQERGRGPQGGSPEGIEGNEERRDSESGGEADSEAQPEVQDTDAQEIPGEDPGDGSRPDAPVEPGGCKGIDFLVVVDNSGSMKDEQENLIASFPGFLDTIRGAVEKNQSSFNILVTDTDADGCESLCKAHPNSYCPARQEFCVNINFDQPRACDATLGAGRRTDGKGNDCGLPEGRRYLQSSDKDEAEAFRCLGNQGTGGAGDERTMGAVLGAVSSDLLGKDGCNAGFLRKDAILVVLFVTDEEDGVLNTSGARRGSQGEPMEWKQKLIAAKGGDEKGVVVVGLYGDIGKKDAICEESKPGGITGAQESPRLTQFVHLFGDYGRSGSVCAADYNPFLQDVVGLISTSCDDFVPPE